MANIVGQHRFKGGILLPSVNRHSPRDYAKAQRTRRRNVTTQQQRKNVRVIHVNVPPPERRRRDRQRTFSLPAAFLRCTPFRELYNSTARGSGCRASESDPAGRGAKYREDVRCAWRCDGEQAGADGEVGGSCSALDLDYTVMYTVFSTLMVSSPGAAKTAPYTPGHASHRQRHRGASRYALSRAHPTATPRASPTTI